MKASLAELGVPHSGLDRPLRPAELRLLVSGRSDSLGIAATVLDLAIRGFIAVEQKPSSDGDCTLAANRPADHSLEAFEFGLLVGLFGEPKHEVSGPSKIRMSAIAESIHVSPRAVRYSLEVLSVQKSIFKSMPSRYRELRRLLSLLSLATGLATNNFGGHQITVNAAVVLTNGQLFCSFGASGIPGLPGIGDLINLTSAGCSER